MVNQWEKHIPDDLIEAFLDRLFTDHFKYSVYDMTKGLQDYAYSSIKLMKCNIDECTALDNVYDELDISQDEVKDLRAELHKYGMKMKFLKNNSVLFYVEGEEEDV